MIREDAESLAASIKEQIFASIDAKYYYSSRVRYLNAITEHIKRLDKGQRHCILALNSSVAAQRILQHRGYDFRSYFQVFRERAGFGDLVIRVYCLVPAERVDYGTQLSGIRTVIDQNQMQEMVNLYKTEQEDFNCAYVLPFRGSDLDSVLKDTRNDAFEDVDTAIKLVDKVMGTADLQRAIFFREFMDYDLQHAEGCGYKYQPGGPTAEALEIMNEYQKILRKSRAIPAVTAASTRLVGIVVALPVEFDAVNSHLNESVLLANDLNSGVAFHKGTITTNTGKVIDIIIAQLPETGNIASALGTSLLIQRYGVQFLFHVGIAGGLKGEVNLGDVVVGKTIIYAEKQKVYADAERPEIRILDYRFSELATVHNGNRYQRRIKCFPPLGGSHSAHKAIFDCTIMSGEKVIADPTRLTTIKSQVVRKLLAVENEAAGVYFAGNAINPSGTRYATVKGISDMADSEKNDDWHEYAAAAAAAYTFEAIHSLA